MPSKLEDYTNKNIVIQQILGLPNQVLFNQKYSGA